MWLKPLTFFFCETQQIFNMSLFFFVQRKLITYYFEPIFMKWVSKYLLYAILLLEVTINLWGLYNDN